MVVVHDLGLQTFRRWGGGSGLRPLAEDPHLEMPT